jgi:putative membrane protein
MDKETFSPEALKPSDKLAIERTIMATDRTLLAWIRTALSLISFGFTIFKLLQYIYEQGQTAMMRPETPRNIGLLLIFAGTVPLIFILVEYVRSMKRMGRKDNLYLTPNFLVAALIILLGSTMIISILSKIALL